MKKQKIICVLLVLIFFVCANVYAGKGGTIENIFQNS